MHFKYKKPMILLIGILLLVFITPTSLVANCEKTSAFQAQFGILGHKLYVSIDPSLYDYYSNMTHTINSASDYASLVTPQAVESIAENIQKITGNMPYSYEQFADAVLSLVHQIRYEVTNPRYPVETLVDNSGDCVSLSILAASIMQAGGLDVVLIDYTGITPGHMNVGVYLPYMPVYHTAGEAPTDFVYNNKTYWTAEATPAENWKVGDQWSALAKATPTIIPLENASQSSPAQVASSLNTPLLPSSVTINLSQDQSSANMTQEQSNVGENTRALTISGSISPAYSGENVSIYVSSGSSNDYFTTVTDDAGGYTLTWNFTSGGTYYIRTSWSGTSNYAGADSEELTVFVGPETNVQFNAPNYNYIFGQQSFVNFASYQILPLQGVNDFLSIPLETGDSYSYDFTILQAGQTVSNVKSEIITVPGWLQPQSWGRNQPYTYYMTPSQTVTVPVDVPTGLTPIMLPSDFNQTINNQFCFILQNNGGNVSLNVNGLNDYNMSNIVQSNENNVTFMNATENVKENVWYNVTATISDNGITSNLYNSNGTLIESMVTPNNSTNDNETVMLVANNANSAVIFKDLTVNSLNSSTQPPESKATNFAGLIFPYLSPSIFLVTTSAVALIYVKKRRKIRQKNGIISQ